MERKSWHPKRLRAKHMLMIAMSMRGMSNKQIAAALQIAESRVSSILTSPAARRVLAKVEDRLPVTLAERFQTVARDAFEVIYDQMNDDEASNLDRRACAFGILDRAGYSKVEKKLIQHAAVTDETAEKLAGVVAESREIRGKDLGAGAYRMIEAGAEEKSEDSGS
jgi:predicted transcriptional regulator